MMINIGIMIMILIILIFFMVELDQLDLGEGVLMLKDLVLKIIIFQALPNVKESDLGRLYIKTNWDTSMGGRGWVII